MVLRLSDGVTIKTLAFNKSFKGPGVVSLNSVKQRLIGIELNQSQWINQPLSVYHDRLVYCLLNMGQLVLSK